MRALIISVGAERSTQGLFHDLESGPNSGGANGKGVFVTLWGKGFGAAQGTSTVTVGGGSVDNYPLWSDGKITVQLSAGSSTGNIVVNVAGVGSSNGLPFTVREPAISFLFQQPGIREFRQFFFPVADYSFCQEQNVRG